MPFVLHGVAVTRALLLLPPDPDVFVVLRHIWIYELERTSCLQDVWIGILHVIA